MGAAILALWPVGCKCGLNHLGEVSAIPVDCTLELEQQFATSLGRVQSLFQSLKSVIS